MRKINSGLLMSLALTLVLLTAPTNAVAQQTTLFGGFDSPGIGSDVAFARNSRVTFSRVTWYFVGLAGPVDFCSFKMEKSDFGTTWTDLIPLQDCSSAGKFEFITPTLSHILRFNVTAFSGPRAVFMFWEGFTGVKCGLDYRGVFSVVSSPDPAAGAELSIDIPVAERWRVYSASFELQANSTMADREVFLTASKGSDEYFRTFADGVVKADQKGIFTTSSLGFVGTAGLGPSSINQPTDVRTIMIPIYADAFIPGGHTLATDTNGMQSGDDYSTAAILAERCPN